MTKQANSAGDWILNNITYPSPLNKETKNAVTDFALLWMLFEWKVCKNYASLKSFEHFSEWLALVEEENGVPLDTLKELMSFWEFRYISHGATNERFEKLAFRKNDKKELASDVLLGKVGTKKDIILVLLIIVYRMRNNLFHGVKIEGNLNFQKKNLNHAVKVLKEFLMAAKRMNYQ